MDLVVVVVVQLGVAKVVDYWLERRVMEEYATVVLETLRATVHVYLSCDVPQ